MSATPKRVRSMVRPVILLHGWPYDIYSFVDVASLLAGKGYRVIVPICAYGTRDFFQVIRSAMVNRRHLPWTSLH